MALSLRFGIAFAGLSYFAVQFIRMVRRGIELKADSWMVIGRSSIIRMLLPNYLDIPGVVHGRCQPHKVKYSVFERVGKDGYIEVSMSNPKDCVLILADLQTFKDITRPREPYYHDLQANKTFLGLLGPNLLTLEGEDWKHHRKIAQRAFSEKLPQLVWRETMSALEELYEIWDLHHGQRVSLPQTADMTKTLGLMVVSSAALGRPLSWSKEQQKPEPGFTMSFQKALEIVSSNIVTRVFLPSWAEGLTQTTREVSTGYNEFKRYVQQMMDSQRKGGAITQDTITEYSNFNQSNANVFSVLLAASEEDVREQGKGLTDEETSTNTIAFALGLLACYPEIQREVYEEIKQVMGPSSSLKYNDMNELKLVFGTFMESLRMYPVSPQNVRIPSEDSALTVARNGPNSDGSQRETLFVPANSYIYISMIGIHYNPKYWPEPDEFRPARFSGAYNKDALTTFSVGRRICIGQKFAEVEGTAALASILLRYEVTVDSTRFPEVPGENIRDRRDRLLEPIQAITWTPRNLPLIFTRRT